MSNLATILILILLVGAQSYAESGATSETILQLEGMIIIGDPDAPEQMIPTHRINHVDVNVTWYDTKEELNRIYQRNCLRQIQDCEKSVLAFTQIWVEDEYCEIHSLVPVNVDGGRMNILGHEFCHCLFGEFHE